MLGDLCEAELLPVAIAIIDYYISVLPWREPVYPDWFQRCDEEVFTHNLWIVGL